MTSITKYKMKPKVKSGAEKRRFKEKQQLEKMGLDPKQKKLMFFKTSDVQKVSSYLKYKIRYLYIFYYFCIIFFTSFIHN